MSILRNLVIDNQLCNARVQAAAILKAWGSNNLALLHSNLALAAEETLVPVADTGEGERLEMLGAIAGTMRLLLASGQFHSADRYLPLLRHLASPPPAMFECAFRC
jgi:hypothetical protein